MEEKMYILHAVATYKDDFLEAVTGLAETSKRRNAEDIQATFPFPNKLSQLPEFQAKMPFLIFEDITAIAEVLEEPDKAKREVNRKIAIFRTIWQEKDIGKFAVTKQDRADWSDTYKDVPANTPEIVFYLATNSYPIKGNKGISDFCRHYNDVIRMMQADKQPKKAEYPDYWDKYVYTELGKKSNDHVLAYARHLVSLGYKKKTDNTGATYYAKEQ